MALRLMILASLCATPHARMSKAHKKSKRDQEKEKLAEESAAENDSNQNPINKADLEKMSPHLLENFAPEMRSRILQNSLRIARGNRAYFTNASAQYNWRKMMIARHVLEWQKKFSISFAVIVLFFVGAPLGAIIRKGGMGMPVVVSVFIFIVYHVTSFSFEKLGRFMYWTPFQAMWTANFILLPIGLWLTYKSATDSVIFNIELYLKPFQKISDIFVRRFKKLGS